MFDSCAKQGHKMSLYVPFSYFGRILRLLLRLNFAISKHCAGNNIIRTVATLNFVD
jgi:hypothetical protein